MAAWIAATALAGASEAELVEGLCQRLLDAGWQLDRCNVIIDTLHPLHEGRVFSWLRRGGETMRVTEYGRVGPDDESQILWQQSPFYQLYSSGDAFLRRRIKALGPNDFPILDDLAREGATDYLAVVNRFGAEAIVGEMDCIMSSWTSYGESGFSDAQVAELRHLVQFLALALRGTSLLRITETLAETYLGHETGKHVLAGNISRGRTQKISAALWFSDLKGFTRITGKYQPDEVISFLNDYAEVVIDAIHENGGEVLKLQGDGVLAIFNQEDLGTACNSALDAQRAVYERTRLLNTRRAEDGLPTTTPYLALHVGEVFYGNIGSRDRLDFTVIGSAVNEISRIASFCRSVERDALVSPAFLDAVRPDERARFVSVGRYALRGVERPIELFTPMD